MKVQLRRESTGFQPDSQADSFRYNIFEARKDRDGIYVVHAYHPMTFYRYPNLESDVMRALTDFVEFAHRYLPERLAA